MAKQNNTYEDILSNLRAGKLEPIYFLFGEEPYYIDLISDYIQNNVLEEASRDFDQTILYGKDVTMPAVINYAKRYPMMGKHQVIIVKEAQQLKDWDDIVHYVSTPQPSTLLVFCYKYGSPDKRKKWYQDITKKAVTYESVAIRDYQINAWISNYCKSKNIVIDAKSISMLGEFLGTDISKLVNEIDKLQLLQDNGRKQITPELIEKNIGISKDFNVFELQKVLVEKDPLKANRIINYFADSNKSKEHVIILLAQLFKFFSDLMIYHYIADKSESNVAMELKINPYFVKDYQKAASAFNQRKVMNTIGWIRETDARFKGIDNPSTDDGELLKELIYKIIH